MNEHDDKPRTLRCPSAPCRPGAQLIGIVMPDGRVAMTPDEIFIDEDFVERARVGRAPEKRFRFSSPCIAAGCKQWTGSRCGIADEVDAHAPDDAIVEALPACAIRDDCRWYDQLGARACHVCPLVVTDGRPEVDG